jgi:hypothetical protein
MQTQLPLSNCSLSFAWERFWMWPLALEPTATIARLCRLQLIKWTSYLSRPKDSRRTHRWGNVSYKVHWSLRPHIAFFKAHLSNLNVERPAVLPLLCYHLMVSCAAMISLRTQDCATSVQAGLGTPEYFTHTSLITLMNSMLSIRNWCLVSRTVLAIPLLRR